jgi:hypothetical protein
MEHSDQMQELVGLFEKENNEDLLNKLEELVLIYKEKSEHTQKIPLELFSDNELGILEVLVKFLKEECRVNYSEIGLLLHRDARTIWTIYQSSLKKKTHNAYPSASQVLIPISVFSDRRLSPLEALTFYLKHKGVSLKNICRLVNRNYGSIWQSYRNASNKLRIKNE